MNGKGDSPRPKSVDEETFSKNWERIFQNKPDADYITLLNSGMFYEFFPGLTGEWEQDKNRWKVVKHMKLNKE